MVIEFVNHASISVVHDGIHLISDPWLEGRAFHNGWGLAAPTAFGYDRFAEITHIWFSHEHPDHFSPPNLKKIDPEYRKRITILFQQTRDKKVISYCKSLGFEKIIELDKYWHPLTPKFSLLNIPHTDGDSWLCIKTDKHTLLNINDCGLESDAELKTVLKQMGAGQLDVLFTQFSYANWSGNADQPHIRKRHAEGKLREIARQIHILKPVYTVPFASYIWFCHSENFYMNDAINTAEQTFSFIHQHTKTTPVVLFPGDKWAVGEPHESHKSIEAWESAYSASVKENLVEKPQFIGSDELMQLGETFAKNLLKQNAPLLKRFLKPCTVHITDHDQMYSLSLAGFSPLANGLKPADISLSSEAMAYCFRFLWGGATLRINGRYQVPAGGDFEKWKWYFQISELNNHGLKFGWNYLARTGISKLRAKLSA